MLAKKFQAVLVMVLLLVSLEACGPGGIAGKATPTPVPPLVNYQKAIFTVEEGPIISEKELQADITPSKQDELFFRTSGFVTRVVVKPGDLVKKGDILAEMQVDDVMTQLQQAQIDLEVAQSNQAKDKTQSEYDIAQAQANVYELQKRVQLGELDLQNAFGEQKERAQINLDITKKDLELAQQHLDLLSQASDPSQDQSVKRNELAVERLEGLLAERQITSPYDCIVLTSSVRPGQQVDAFYSAFTIGDPSELVVRTQYDFDISNQLSKDTEALVRFHVSDDADKGLVTTYLPSFSPISITDQTQVKNSTASSSQFFYFALPKDATKDEVQVGRQVDVVVVLGKKDSVLLLPPAAIREYRGLNFVIVTDGTTNRRVEINKIGLKATDKWEIIADLKVGDKVLGP